MKKFHNKIALVTGGGRGIGAQIVRELVGEGAFVYVNYLDNPDEVNILIQELGKENTCGICADVSEPQAVKSMFEQIKEHHGALDVLVNNAGIVGNMDFLDTTFEKWNKTFAVNVNGPFLCTQSAAKLMSDRGGSIVNIGSIRGLYNYGRPPIADYCASKAAVISMTKTLAKELAPKIRVNCVSPGVADTPLIADYPEEFKEKIRANMYTGQLVQPEDIAKSVSFLLSDDASSITGENLVVDGGQSLRIV
jgi:NAD(P)-dependent dehydrogenase (short-subunit alcohol dehydrogenase family)